MLYVSTSSAILLYCLRVGFQELGVSNVFLVCSEIQYSSAGTTLFRPLADAWNKKSRQHDWRLFTPVYVILWFDVGSASRRV